MITLHGFSFSNYYNLVKHVLMYKGIAFTEDEQYGADEAYLKLSPVGKIPSISTEQGGNLSESSVCCDYLEETYPEQPLYPTDSFERNQVRQIMKVSELYLELPCRRLIGYVFGNTDAPEPVLQEVRGVLERGVRAMNLLCKFDPYVAGSEMTMADIYLRYVLTVADMTSAAKLQWDVGAEIEGLKTWQAMMADSDIARKIDADMQANAPAFFAHLKAHFGIE